MVIRTRIQSWILRSVAAPALLLATMAAAQARPAQPAPAVRPAQPSAVPTPVPTDKDMAATQSQLIKLLRISPRLTTVLSRDPSLLSNQEYVTRNNPQLAEFIAIHPEVALNPEGYLFTHMHQGDGEPDEALEREVFSDIYRSTERQSPFAEFTRDLSPLLAFACFLVALIWLIRVFLENRRWSRIFKLQSEVHGKLIDKFSSNQDLALYMETEAGRRFLEAAPIPVGFQPEQRMPNAVARVLTPLQIGIVLVLLGAGFFLLRHAGAEMETPMLVFGTIALMPGLGFILSAGVTWLLAARLGLMPGNLAPNDSVNPPYGKDLQ